MAALLASLMAPASPAAAASGDLDLSFGDAGTVTTPTGAGSGAFALVRQPDGKLAVAGTAVSGGDSHFGLARYLQNGDLDAGFGNGGVVTTAIGTASDNGRALVLQPDGKLVVAGSTQTATGSNFALARYLPNGSLDGGFGSGGVASTTLGGASDVAQALVLQPDGKLVAAGGASPTGPTDFGLVRYNPDGSLDAGFGTGGIVVTSLGSGNDLASALALQPDGKLVAAGSARLGNDTVVALVRYDADGNLDAGFGSGGIVTTLTVGSFSTATSILLQADGGLVVGGLTVVAGNTDSVLVRYDAAGTLDPDFGNAGVVHISLGPMDDEVTALALEPDGKILAVGRVENGAGTSSSFVVARFQPNGSLDGTFGSGGVVTTSVGGDSFAFAAVRQPNDRLVVAGRGTAGFALARYFLTPFVCGDGTVDLEEECDDANGVEGDGCTSLCATEVCLPPPADLVAWWPADGSAIDIAGAHDATLIGGVSFVAGRALEAFDLDGIDDYVEVASDPAWDLGTDPFTIDLWVRLSSLTPGQAFVARNGVSVADCAAEDKWAFEWSGGQLAFHVSSTGLAPVDVVAAPWSPVVGQWYHLAITRGGESYLLYIDGMVVASGTDPSSLPSPAAPLLIGQSGDCAPGQEFVSGVIDEVEVFDRALDSLEVEALFLVGSGGKCKVCGDGVLSAGEECDGVGETPTCDSDCSRAICGDATHNLSAGEECDTGDESATCDVDCTFPVCGDDVLNFAAGEDCEDGNLTNGDCCSSTCVFEPQGSPCLDDGDPCTVDACDGAGTCLGAMPTDCRQAGKSILILKKGGGGSRDKLIWKWLRGEATPRQDFADPTTESDYALCLYQGAAQSRVDDLVVPADPVKWKEAGATGFKYKDKARAVDGVDKIILKSGVSGKPKIIMKGKGTNLPDIPLPLEPPLTVQLVNDRTGVCWEGSYSQSELKKNETDLLKAKASAP